MLELRDEGREVFGRMFPLNTVAHIRETNELGEVDEYDEQFVLEPGMTIVLEPVTWRDGHAGYRCEELVFVTDDGHEQVSAYPNEPFE